MTSTPSLQPTQMQGEGRGVGIQPGSRLPGRNGRSLAEVWGLTDDQVKRVYFQLKRKDYPRKAPKPVAPRKISFAGYDRRETQFK